MDTMGVMLRFEGVSISQPALEHALGCPVVWSRQTSHGGQHAQVDVSMRDEDAVASDNKVSFWNWIDSTIRRLGDNVAKLVDDGAVQSAQLDVGLLFYGSNMVSSVVVPSSICELVGRSRIAIAVTYYATSDEPEVLA